MGALLGSVDVLVHLVFSGDRAVETLSRS